MDDHLYDKARKRIQKKKNIFKDITGWISTSIFLLLINLLFSPGFMWCLFPIGFYGLSILITYIDQIREIFDDDWEERELQKEYNRLLKKRQMATDQDEDILIIDHTKEKTIHWNDNELV